VKKKRVVISLLGPTLDGGQSLARRHQRWRPNVAIGLLKDLAADRLELLYQPRHAELCDLIVSDLAAVAPQLAVRPHAVPYEDPWDLEEVYSTTLDFVERYPFDTAREEYLVNMTTGSHINQVTWYMLVEARYIPGNLLQLAPGQGESKVVGTFSVIDLDLSRYDRIAQRFARAQREGLSALKAGIDTRNAAFNRLIAQIERVAGASRSPILLTGPTGAGKTHLARRIYELKKSRRLVKGPLVELNCATLRGDSAMSMLFGHRKGAFTGAVAHRDGLLLKANDGVLFLDEIGNLGIDEQTMLLKAVEEQRFLPVGSDTEVGSRFQLIAGTNTDLNAAVREGRFREDLLARINLWSFALPGLVDRPEDVEPNLDYELRRLGASLGVNATINREARRAYLDFATAPQAAWRGNFRDLNASVTRMATLAEGGRITKAVVVDEIERLTAAWGAASANAADRGDPRVAGLLGAVGCALDPFDETQLASVLAICLASTSLADAGRKLFAQSLKRRQSSNDSDRLRKYLARYGLSWADVTAARRA
jgi:transcriptional regulatory protein RtcR